MPVLPSEFEEKEYEAPLYNQLERTPGLVWSPGQVALSLAHRELQRPLFR